MLYLRRTPALYSYQWGDPGLTLSTSHLASISNPVPAASKDPKQYPIRGQCYLISLFGEPIMVGALVSHEHLVSTFM